MTWLVLGACLGISGYRRAGRLLRELTPGRGARRPRPLAAFARDVREGMELYEQQRRDDRQRRSGQGPTLGLHQVRLTSGGRELPASRNGSSGPGGHH